MIYLQGPTAIAYSDDPVAPAKVSSNFEKKLENFKIIGGGYDGEKIDIEKINFLATLPSMDELRGKILGLNFCTCSEDCFNSKRAFWTIS